MTLLERDQQSASIGLTSAEAQRRLSEHGANVVSEEAPPAWKAFLRKLWAPIPWLLEAAVVLQLILGEYVEAAVVAGLLLFNAGLGFVQEGRATAALAALKKRLAPTALVCRDGKWASRPAADVVPGDAVRLTLGTLVPADVRIFSGSVMVDQSMMTGESVPEELGPRGQVFAGSLVRRGQAIAEVTATGARTYFGGAARNLAAVNGTVAVLIIAYAYALALPFSDVIGLALTALLASIPVALPATFTLSAAISAQILADRGVLLTRLAAAHEAAAIDVLCADKTGTLTLNQLEIAEVVALPGFDRERVLALAALASSETDQDPIDTAVRKAASALASGILSARLVRFVPFHPDTKMSEAFALWPDGTELRVVKGAFHEVAAIAEPSRDARGSADELAAHGHRVIAVAEGQPKSLRFAGLIAISDPPRSDSASLIADLRDMGVRTTMVTGDSAVTAATIARKVGIADTVCSPELITSEAGGDNFGIFARVAPDQKYRIVASLQRAGHVVGMCGDGVNDAPALRQAQIGIAVSTATDVAKAAASMVMTEPGLAGIVFAVREGRIAFQRLLTYTFNMLVKKVEIVLFLAIGLSMTGQPVMTPVLMVLILVTNDFLSMSLTADRASPSLSPSRWRMQNITAAAIALGACKLAFSVGIVAVGRFALGLEPVELQTLAFVVLVLGNQALLYALRERRHMWRSTPSLWVLASSAVDVGIASLLALTGTLMAPLSWPLIATVFGAAAGFALILDQIKIPLLSAFKIE